VVEGGFLAAYLLKVLHGGYVPLLLAGAMIFLMWTWRRGRAAVARSEQSDLDIKDVVAMLSARPPMRAKGTAIFLTTEPGKVPASLMHNLKHNQVLHEQVVLLTVKVVRRPRVTDDERVAIESLAPGFKCLVLTFGYMETPNIIRGLSIAKAKGMKFDIMRTSFFVSRHTYLPRRRVGLGRLQDMLFVYFARNAVRSADFFQIPPSRVVELGSQVTI
jgi:KUP system potassium uptake protein